MNGVIELQLWQFSLVYVLLIVVGLIMKRARIDKINLLLLASFRMTIQLILAGLILTYIFKNPHPLFTLLYLSVMIGFTIWSSNKASTSAKWVISLSILLSESLSSVFLFGGGWCINPSMSSYFGRSGNTIPLLGTFGK